MRGAGRLATQANSRSLVSDVRPALLTDALENSTLHMERNMVRHNRLCGLEVAESAWVIARQNAFGGNAEAINVDHHQGGAEPPPNPGELVGNSTGETADRPEGSEAAVHRVGALLLPMKGVGGRHEATGVALRSYLPPRSSRLIASPIDLTPRRQWWGWGNGWGCRRQERFWRRAMPRPERQWFESSAQGGMCGGFTEA